MRLSLPRISAPVLFLVTFAIFIFARLAFAEAPIDEVIPNDSFWLQLLQMLGGLKGITLMGGVVLLVQAVMLFMKTPMAEFAGKWRLLLVAGLSVLAMFLGALASGLSWQAALANGGVLAAGQVFIHQLLKQLFEKEEMGLQMGKVR